MSKLNVVCLISGGKDSLFSILHCISNGHNVVAIANLHPPASDGNAALEDLDSFMYQTVGHTIIPLYQEALGLPLYRHEIHGSARNQDKCYGHGDDDDETEALVPLLQKVKLHHPEVNGVSTGAILSDYQRTRVESVAIRLGLVPLSFLWQWPNLRPNLPESLLHDMAAVGQDSRIIKVASGGLDESFLWQDVANTRTLSRLDKATQRFGTYGDGAVLGEGGEYETLAIDGPLPLWKGFIHVEDDMRKIVNGEAGSASVLIKHARIERKELGDSNRDALRIPSLFEPQFDQILNELQILQTEHTVLAAKEDLSQALDPKVAHSGLGRGWDTPALQTHVLHHNLLGEGHTPEAQVHSIMEQAAVKIKAVGHTFGDVAYTSIILRNMADFASINTVYGSYFPHPNPPARVTIACAAVIPDEKYLMISFTSVKTEVPGLRKGLHVQSRSYWAPANIGPYSQAIQIPSGGDDGAVIYVAGQIPLVPASMELPKPKIGNPVESFMTQAVLALQHLDRIGRVVGVSEWNSAAAFITASSEQELAVRSALIRHAWRLYLSPDGRTSDEGSRDDAEDDSFDVWDAKFGNQRAAYGNSGTLPTTVHSKNTMGSTATLHVLKVDTLPRNSNVEWVVIGSKSGGSRGLNPHFEQLLATFQDQLL